MATISSTIELYDKVSAPVNKIIGAMNNMVGIFESVDSAMNNGFDPSAIDETRRAIDLAAREMSELGEEIEKNEEKQEDFNDEIKNSISSIAGMVGAYVGLSQIKEIFTQAIDFASDLQEVQNVVDVAFGNSSSVIDEWATTTLNSFGLNELSAKQFAGTMGAMLKSSGMAGDEVADMSMRIAELAGDMASFYNLEGEEAFSKLRSGISGETEPLKQLGINMSVANLEAYALSQGITETYNSMSQSEQVMLRYNYLMQATKDAQGDFERTSDSFANQQKLLTENWKAFTGEIVSDVLPVLAEAMGVLNAGIGFMSENWAILEPILLGLTAAVGAYTVALGVYKGVQIATNIAKAWAVFQATAHKAALAMETGATFAATAAQYGFNAALYACPLTWVVLVIVAIISLIYLVIAIINKCAKTTYSATGMIAGALAVLGAYIWNWNLGMLDIVLWAISTIVNAFVLWVNFLGNAFNDPIGSIIHLFGTMGDYVLSILETIASAMDKLFGTNFAGAVQGWRSGLNGMVEDAANKYGNGKYEKLMDEVNLSSESLGLKRWAYGDAYNTGYGWGKGVDEYVSGASTEDIEQIAENTEKIAGSLDITNEDLKYLKDLAERDVINRFTTAEIKVDMTNNNSIGSNMDLDGIVEYLVVGVNEAMAIAAEGVGI